MKKLLIFSMLATLATLSNAQEKIRFVLSGTEPVKMKTHYGEVSIPTHDGKAEITFASDSKIDIMQEGKITTFILGKADDSHRIVIALENAVNTDPGVYTGQTSDFKYFEN